MGDVIDSDGFRANVGIVLIHGDEVFLGRRSGARGWQFPQGGVRSGESLEQALEDTTIHAEFVRPRQ